MDRQSHVVRYTIGASISVSGFMLLNERQVRDTGNLIWGF